MPIKGYSATYENGNLIPRDVDIIRHFTLYFDALETRAKMMLDAFVDCRELEIEYIKEANNQRENADELYKEIDELYDRLRKVEDVNVELLQNNMKLYDLAKRAVTGYKCAIKNLEALRDNCDHVGELTNDPIWYRKKLSYIQATNVIKEAFEPMMELVDTDLNDIADIKAADYKSALSDPE